ncbi:MAG: TVP38/TMEM64 family protein [Spirochaetaceae bacterium]|nr:MAG: TVP38/TMEM64 family protein [Spirochaetaceae bacterium]
MNKTKGNIRVALVLTAVVALFVAGYLLEAPRHLQTALTWVDGLGALGPVVYIGMYVLVSVLVIPGSILTLGAGAVFGVARGTLFSALGATAGATAAFLLGRTLLHNWVARKVQSSPRLAAVDEAVEQEGWRLVFLLRLSPLVPFSMSNYVYGLTKVRTPHYVLASFVGMLPGVLLYSYIGSLVRQLAELGTSGASTTNAEWALYAVGLVATVVATGRVTIVARRALARKKIALEVPDTEAAGGA